jgi:hypothetical protein
MFSSVLMKRHWLALQQLIHVRNWLFDGREVHGVLETGILGDPGVVIQSDGI